MAPDPSDISVTISLYNKKKTIERAVLSAVNQAYPPKNIIIVDDGSTDGSSEIAKDLAGKFPGVKYISQENRGVSVARNRGVEAADTECVCFLDADDVWEPGYMENLLELIAAVPDADFYSLAYRMYSMQGWLKPEVGLPAGFVGVVDAPLRTYSNGYGLIHTSAICFKKTFFRQIGGFPEGINFGEDLYLWLKACLRGTLAFSNKISVTLYKEPVNSVNRRKLHPYHVKYFTENLSSYNEEEQKALKEFLIKNIYIQWAAAKLESNHWQQHILRKYCFRLNWFRGLILLAAGFMPSAFIRFLKKRRTKNRLIIEA